MAKATRLVTPEFRLLYGKNLMSAEDKEFTDKDGKVVKYKQFSASLGFAKPAEGLKDVREAVLAFVKEELPKEHAAWVKAFASWPNLPTAIMGYKQPFLNGDEKRNPINHGQVLIRCKTRYAPEVIDRAKAKIEDPAAVYAGSYGRASISPYVYASVAGGLPGIGFYLGNYQFTKNGERLAGSSADEDFDALPESDDDLKDFE